MEYAEVMEWLEATASPEVRESLTRYGIPTEHALGIPMGLLKKQAKGIGHSHELAGRLWATGIYEARTLAALVDEPAEVTAEQMDHWAHEFDSWAICDTVCFSLFDRTPYAWDKVREWEPSVEEFVRRAAYALVWALSVHDKQAPDEAFVTALKMLETARPDPRPLVKKAMDMALRATGKRNDVLRERAIETAKRLAEDADRNRAWIGRHTLRELERTG
jgi:3-methyladenine DNA glycosylase AlkD